MARAMESARMREALGAAAESGAESKAHRLHDAIEAQWSRARLAIRAAVVAEDARSEPIAQAIDRAFRDEGVVPAVSDATVVIRCRLTLDRAASYDPAKRATKWSVVIAVTERGSGRILDELRFGGIAVSMVDADRAAADAAAAEAAERLPAFFGRVFRGG